MANKVLFKGFERLGSFPLDRSSVFSSESELDQYLAYSKIPYDGQIVGVTTTNNERIYLIKRDNTLNTFKKVDITETPIKENIDPIKLQLYGPLTGDDSYSKEGLIRKVSIDHGSITNLTTELGKTNTRIGSLSALRFYNTNEKIYSRTIDSFNEDSRNLVTAINEKTDKSDFNEKISDINNKIDEINSSYSNFEAIDETLSFLLYDTNKKAVNAEGTQFIYPTPYLENRITSVNDSLKEEFRRVIKENNIVSSNLFSNTSIYPLPYLHGRISGLETRTTNLENADTNIYGKIQSLQTQIDNFNAADIDKIHKAVKFILDVNSLSDNTSDYKNGNRNKTFNTVFSAIDEKQAKLNDTQLEAVNSGINSDLVNVFKNKQNQIASLNNIYIEGNNKIGARSGPNGNFVRSVSTLQNTTLATGITLKEYNSVDGTISDKTYALPNQVIANPANPGKIQSMNTIQIGDTTYQVNALSSMSSMDCGTLTISSNTNQLFKKDFSLNSWESLAVASDYIKTNNLTLADVTTKFGWNVGDEKILIFSDLSERKFRLVGINKDGFGLLLESIEQIWTSYNNGTIDLGTDYLKDLRDGTHNTTKILKFYQAPSSQNYEYWQNRTGHGTDHIALGIRMGG